MFVLAKGAPDLVAPLWLAVLPVFHAGEVLNAEATAARPKGVAHLDGLSANDTLDFAGAKMLAKDDALVGGLK